MGPFREFQFRTLALAIAVLVLLFGHARPAPATTIQWNAGFSGFKTGDVWFVSSVNYSTSGLNRGPTLFVYSPSDDQIAEIMPLFPPFGSIDGYLAFDPTGRGLFIGDVEKIQLLKPDGSLVPFATTYTYMLDLAVAPDGTVFTAENAGIRRYVNGVGTQVASVGTNVRGLAVVGSGFVVGIDPNTSLYKNDNLLWLNSLGSITQRSRIGFEIPGMASLARRLSDGKLVVVTDFFETLNLVSSDGSSVPFADESDGIFATFGIAIDALTGLDVWVTTRGRPASLQEFATDGTHLTYVPLELNQLGYPNDKGAFVPSGVVSVLVPVIAAPGISKTFGTATLSLNGTTSLSFTLSNSNGATPLTGVGVSDSLPSGLVIATPNGLTGGCGGGGITATAGAGTVSLSGATLAASASCTFAVNVTGTTGGVKHNTTGDVISIGGGTGETASASVTVASFTDVPPTDPFFTWIEALLAAGITGGCETSPAQYCSDSQVTRDQMAVFLLRGFHGAGYEPSAATGTMFTDVSVSQPFAKWIEQLAREGITGGCATSPPQYCPASQVTRDQMAVFLLRAKHGAAYQPPAATGTMFTDVPVSQPFATWIEQLAREGITGGCGGTTYCPDDAVTRGQMAVFLVRAFGLPL